MHSLLNLETKCFTRESHTLYKDITSVHYFHTAKKMLQFCDLLHLKMSNLTPARYLHWDMLHIIDYSCFNFSIIK